LLIILLLFIVIFFITFDISGIVTACSVFISVCSLIYFDLLDPKPRPIAIAADKRVCAPAVLLL
jgi:hypothetical protein